MQLKQIKIFVTSLCLAVVVICTGCGGGGTFPKNPAESSSSSISQAGTVQDSQYAVTPQNAENGWIKKDGYLFVAKMDDNGRLLNGSWQRKEDYPHTTNQQISFTTVPDDSKGGSNCVWDGKTLTSRPINPSDKNTYATISGKKYVCQIAEDGTVFNGRFEDISYVNSKGIHPASPYKPSDPERELFYFDSFPYDGNGGTDYVWDGYHLKYSPVRKIDSRYVSATKERPKQLALDDPRYYDWNSTPVTYCQAKQTGRLYNGHCCPLSTIPPDDLLPEDCIFFLAYPPYFNVDNFIWDGSTLTYDSLNK